MQYKLKKQTRIALVIVAILIVALIIFLMLRSCGKETAELKVNEQFATVDIHLHVNGSVSSYHVMVTSGTDIISDNELFSSDGISGGVCRFDFNRMLSGNTYCFTIRKGNKDVNVTWLNSNCYEYSDDTVVVEDDSDSGDTPNKSIKIDPRCVAIKADGSGTTCTITINLDDTDIAGTVEYELSYTDNKGVDHPKRQKGKVFKKCTPNTYDLKVYVDGVESNIVMVTVEADDVKIKTDTKNGSDVPKNADEAKVSLMKELDSLLNLLASGHEKFLNVLLNLKGIRNVKFRGLVKIGDDSFNSLGELVNHIDKITDECELTIQVLDLVPDNSSGEWKIKDGSLELKVTVKEKQ